MIRLNNKKTTIKKHLVVYLFIKTFKMCDRVSIFDKFVHGVVKFHKEIHDWMLKGIRGLFAALYSTLQR